MMLLLFLILVAAGVAALWVLWRLAQVRSRRRLLAGPCAALSDAPGEIGISAIGCGISDMRQIERLLAVEYARYEVVAVLDARCQAALLDDLLIRYRLIRVAWRPTEEWPVEGVRGVYRSRVRRFRRLVVVDRSGAAADGFVRGSVVPAFGLRRLSGWLRRGKGGVATSGDLDAGAMVASYDVLLPVAAGEQLLPGAVERLVAELGDRPGPMPKRLRTLPWRPERVVTRDVLAAAGGFAGSSGRGVPRGRRTLWEPLFIGEVRGCRMLLVAALLMAVCGAAAFVPGIWTGWLSAGTASGLRELAGPEVQGGGRWVVAAVCFTGAFIASVWWYLLAQMAAWSDADAGFATFPGDSGTK